MQLFYSFSKYTLNFENFQTKDDVTADVFRKLPTPKTVVKYMSQKTRFKGLFERQHGKRVQNTVAT